MMKAIGEGLVWYSEASTLDNIQILAKPKFHQWLRELKEHVFDSSILNLKNLSVEDGFFHLLDPQAHCYHAYDYNHIDSLGFYLPDGVKMDCRKSGEVIRNKPLDISFDYNPAIKSLVIGQDSAKHYRKLKSMFVLATDKKVLIDLVDEFEAYYEYHPCKVVHFYFDQTATAADATRLESYSQLIIAQLRGKDNNQSQWQVIEHHIGQLPKQSIRYRRWEIVFKETASKFKPVRFNHDNAEQLLNSMQLTGVRQVGNNLFEKDKTSERSKKIAPEDATHLGDAFETLYIGRFKEEYGYNQQDIDIIIG
jgi:hypothetical protein